MQFTIVFDLDGTLVDTVVDIAAALNVSLAAEGLPAQKIDAVRSMVGDGTMALLERGLAACGHDVTPEPLRDLHDILIAAYGRHVADHSTLYADVKSTLERLHSDGFTLSVCTNKPEKLARAIVEQLGIAPLLASLCGGDTCNSRKPAAEPLLHAISLAGGVPERALMVGDSSNDVKTARAADVPVVLLDYGYTDIPAAQLGADRVFPDFADVVVFAHALAGR